MLGCPLQVAIEQTKERWTARGERWREVFFFYNFNLHDHLGGWRLAVAGFGPFNQALENSDNHFFSLKYK